MEFGLYKVMSGFSQDHKASETLELYPQEQLDSLTMQKS